MDSLDYKSKGTLLKLDVGTTGAHFFSRLDTVKQKNEDRNNTTITGHDKALHNRSGQQAKEDLH